MFVNTRYFSEVAISGITRAEKGSLEYNQWYATQAKRCFEGYSVAGVRITGRHYWYLNFWKIRATVPGRSGKVLTSPRFLDIDYDYWHIRERSIKEMKDLAVLKRRQSGNSNKSSADAGYEWSWKPDSHTVIIAGEKKYAKATFGMCKRGLNELKGTEFYKNQQPRKEDYIEASYTEVSDDGSMQTRGIRSIAQYMVSDGDSQALIGLSPSLVIYEEIGKFKGFTQVKEYIDPGMENEGRKTGWNVMFGTGGESDESIDELTDLFYNPAKYNVLEFDAMEEEDPGLDTSSRRGTGRKTAFFIPAYKYHIIDADGNSLIEESKEDLIRRRKLKEGDDRKWLTYVTQMPFNPEEALLVPSGNRFNVKKLREQRVKIFQHLGPDGNVDIGDLDWDYDDDDKIKGIIWKNNRVNGKFRVTEHPNLDPSNKVYRNLYYAGTDSYDRDKVVSVHGSFGSCFVYKAFLDGDHTHNMFTASLYERPTTSAEFYEDTAKLCYYYGKAPNLIEYSNLRIFDWYENNGFIDLLKERPQIAYSNSITNNAVNRFGIDPVTKPYWIQALADDIEKFSRHYYDPEVLETLIKYRDDPEYNCDRTIAMSLAVVNAHDHVRLMAKPRSDVKTNRFHMGRYIVQNGRLVHTF